MFLTVNNLHEYLIGAELVSVRSVVEGDYRVAETGRRNRNFKVLRVRSPGLFVKQMKNTEQQATYTIQREAVFYTAVQSNVKYARLERLIPRLVHYDAIRNVLVLEHIANTESLMERFTRTGSYSPALAASLGRTIGEVHALCSEMLNDPALVTAGDVTPPWPLMMDLYGNDVMRGFGLAGTTTIALVQQQPMLAPLLVALRSEWQRNCIMHADLKFDNCLVRSRSDGTDEVRVVDWELASAGDAAWDVATIFKDYLAACITSAVGALHQTGLRVWGITDLQPAIAEFWKAYRLARGFDATASAVFLHRAVRLTAPRLVTAMLEHLSVAPTQTQSPTMMAQSAAAILMAPHVATMQLTGAAF